VIRIRYEIKTVYSNGPRSYGNNIQWSYFRVARLIIALGKMGEFVRQIILARRLLAAMLFSWFLASGSSLSAQISPPTREELRPTAPEIRQAPSRLSVEGDIERSPCPLADPSYADIMVDVNSVLFNNLKGATAQEMEAAYAPYLGTKQPIAIICEIRDAAATILRNKGYLAAVQVKQAAAKKPLPVF
jgi:hemolysin activation/secretion protein